MPLSRRFALLGDGPTQAARQAALLLAISGLLALVALPNEPDHRGALIAIALADFLIALVTWVLPWNRWRPGFTALMALPAFGVLALSTWVFGGFAAGTGPFFVLIFAWLGLHHRTWVILANTVPATIAYLAPLVAVGASVQVLSSALVLIPVGLGIALVVAGQVRHLREARDRATRAEAWRSALTATLAHDIRSPLTVVQGAVTLLAEHADIPIEERQILLESALRQTGRLNRLASGLLDLERVEQGELRLERRPISVVEALEAATAMISTDAEIRVLAQPDLEVNADPGRLEQILVNLVENALRHGRPPVDVSARGDGKKVRIEVRDHGPGVPTHAGGAIFERLGGDSDHPDSVGLGMWIVRLLTAAHGGTVSYEPAEPGARFIVALPMR